MGTHINAYPSNERNGYTLVSNEGGKRKINLYPPSPSRVKEFKKKNQGTPLPLEQ
jgi:hypothetical protein